MVKQIAPSQTPTYKRVRKEIMEWVNDHSDLVVINDNWYCGMTNNPEIRKAAHKS
ncbi:MAG: hypothetical protein N4A71_10965 [Carboxylicivirga sp.]|nr:hypothetical protein [Carboxylicivirga sp.]